MELEPQAELRDESPKKRPHLGESNDEKSSETPSHVCLRVNEVFYNGLRGQPTQQTRVLDVPREWLDGIDVEQQRSLTFAATVDGTKLTADAVADFKSLCKSRPARELSLLTKLLEPPSEGDYDFDDKDQALKDVAEYLSSEEANDESAAWTNGFVKKNAKIDDDRELAQAKWLESAEKAARDELATLSLDELKKECQSLLRYVPMKKSAHGLSSEVDAEEIIRRLVGRRVGDQYSAKKKELWEESERQHAKLDAELKRLAKHEAERLWNEDPAKFFNEFFYDAEVLCVPMAVSPNLAKKAKAGSRVQFEVNLFVVCAQ